MRRCNALPFLPILLLVACAGLPISTPTEKPMPTAAPTSVPTSHQWESGPVVAEIAPVAGYMEPYEAWGYMPSVVVYANGLVISSSFYGPMTQVSLSRSELCSLLYTIDESGFFDFQEDDYHPTPTVDAGSTNLAVHAWRSNEIGILGDADDEYQPNPFPSALGRTIQALNSFQHAPKAVPYLPDQMILLIFRTDDHGNAPVEEWPSSMPAIATLAPGGVPFGNPITVSLHGKDAVTAYSLLKKGLTQFFGEGNRLYQVTARPVLPFEIAGSIDAWKVSKFESSPLTQLTCTPADISGK
jgi:hypothetical protein